MTSNKSDSHAAVVAAVAGLPALAPLRGGGSYILALSGGLDSSVLLHALSTTQWPVRAIYVHHGMQAGADAWQAHCESLCHQYGISLRPLRVRPDPGTHGGPEAAARLARYVALQSAMGRNDVLLTAQHANDQAETFLQQSLRGAGPRGLAGMPAVCACPPGRLARPLLTLSRRHIARYAAEHNLHWCDDPSNHDPAVDRAWLRSQVWPALQQRWPSVEQTLARSARWCAEAASLADEWGALDSSSSAGSVGNTLLVTRLADMGVARRRNTLRYWLRACGLPAPDHRHMQQIEQLVCAPPGGEPMVNWPGAQLRRFRDVLFASPPLLPVPADFTVDWDVRTPLSLPAACGRLLITPKINAADGLGPERPRVVFRRGGERIHLPGRRHSSALKKLLQAAGVPPWIRQRLPLLYVDGRLAAVADLWFSQAFDSNLQATGMTLRWEQPPPGYELIRIVEHQRLS